MTILQQIDSFYQFASEQIESGATDLFMDALYCLWRVKRPLPAKLSHSVKALQAAFETMHAGDIARPARAA